MQHRCPPNPPPPFHPRSHLKSATVRTLLRVLSLCAAADSRHCPAAAPGIGHDSGSVSHPTHFSDPGLPASAGTLGNCALEKSGGAQIGVPCGEGASAVEEKNGDDGAGGFCSEEISEVDRCLKVGELGGVPNVGMPYDGREEDRREELGKSFGREGCGSGECTNLYAEKERSVKVSSLPEPSCSERTMVDASVDLVQRQGCEVTKDRNLSREAARESGANLEVELGIGVSDEVQLRKESDGFGCCTDVEVEDMNHMILNRKPTTEVDQIVEKTNASHDEPVLSGEVERVESGEVKCSNSLILISPEIGDCLVEGNPVYDNKHDVDDIPIGVDILGHELQHEGNVFETSINSDENTKSCRLEEVGICNYKNNSINLVEDREIEEGEISDGIDFNMSMMDSFSDMETRVDIVAIADDTNGEHEYTSVNKETFGLDVLHSKSKYSSLSEMYGYKVKSNTLLSEQTDGVKLFPGNDGVCISRNDNPGDSRIRGKGPGPEVHFSSLGFINEHFQKAEVPSAENAATKKDNRVREKKKRTSVSDGRKAKNKLAKKRKRAEMNKKLGVKRLKLVPVSKPKVVQICQYYLKGRCRQADKCKFSHDAVPLTKSQPCKYFACNSCLKGDDCPFDHELSKYPCHNYMSKGSCIRGDSCLFSHKVQLAEDPTKPSNTSKEDCLALEKTNLVNKLRVNSNPQLAVYSLFRNGTSSSQSSSLEKNSLSQQPSDVNPEKKLNLLDAKVPPRGITFFSFGGGKEASLDECSNDRKDFESNLPFRNPSEGKMPLPPSLCPSAELPVTMFCTTPPNSSHKMNTLPLDASNAATAGSGDRGSRVITPTPAPKLRSGNMDASLMLEEFLFGGG